MLGEVNGLPISNRVKRLIANDNVIFIGDLVQKTEAELLRTPDLGIKALKEVKAALATLDLRLGMWVPAWPPKNIEQALQQLDSARRASKLHQARGGAIFEAADDHFVMMSGGDVNDLTAAVKPLNRQMQSAILSKARAFADLSSRLDNQPAWKGISQAASRIADLLDRAPEEIPDLLGLLYSAALEIGSFVELDERLAEERDSYAAPLDAEVRRPLSDLVRNLAPWLRAFPSVREADDEASRFLVQGAELRPAFDVIEAAGVQTLLGEDDIAVFQQLQVAAERGAFQGAKAGGRAKRSASNLVIGAVAFAGTFLSGAVASDFSTASPLVHKIGQFLVRTEISIEALIADMPHDLRFSISDFISDLPRNPLLPTEPPASRDRSGAVDQRRKRILTK
ncbi:DNA-directed RNA polymerase subunit alpha C-terminal domain-containing protein [uncultured Sphingomonas sp.]|uniref:DNA-directed RNA polymerase subunit alpha C-terminal domain-containing protein n=1 Tax=uncultured Sphingomonas sp. TaxID=158754 RepID=UPI0025E020ED|nr:DNA-directed RNA polymerase subunit alpha C-terminal domain-containing protein [uncultured Sphingomonas sp.]